jgi:hypothetical protein
MSIHSYEYTHAHFIFMSTSEKRFDIEIHKVGHQERLTVDGDI